MGYTYKPSGKNGIDLIVPTKKGMDEGGMPKGAIVPIGYKCMPEVAAYIHNTDYNVYKAKHCDKENVLTHIQPTGIVNLFGWYVTCMDILSVKPQWTLDVGGPGWFRRVTVHDIKEIERFAGKVVKKVKLVINHYVGSDPNPSRQITFFIGEDVLKSYLEMSGDKRTVKKFLGSYNNEEAEVIYQYADDDGVIVSQEISYCDNFLEEYNLFIQRVQMFNPDKKAGQIATKEDYYRTVYCTNIPVPEERRKK